MSIDATAYRRLMSHFPTGISVITTKAGDHLHGMTANAVTSVSLNPPSLLVVVGKENDTHDLIPKMGGFVVNFLSKEQAWLSDRFADRHKVADMFEGVSWHPGSAGVPILDGSLGYVECTLEHAFPAFDHTIYVGRVAALATGSDGPPLIYHKSHYTTLTLEG